MSEIGLNDLGFSKSVLPGLLMKITYYVRGAAGVRFFSESFQKILKMSKTENEEKNHFLHKRLKN
jgi:hypothetical protein